MPRRKTVCSNLKKVIEGHISGSSTETPRTLLKKVAQEKAQRHSSTYVLNDKRSSISSSSRSKLSSKNRSSRKRDFDHFSTILSDSEENVTPDFLLIPNDCNSLKKQRSSEKSETRKGFKFSKHQNPPQSLQSKRKVSDAQEEVSLKKVQHNLNRSKTKKIDDFFPINQTFTPNTKSNSQLNNNIGSSINTRNGQDVTVGVEGHINAGNSFNQLSIRQNSDSQGISPNEIVDIVSTAVQNNESLSIPRIPDDFTHNCLQHFAGMSIPNNTMSIVNLCCDDFWEQTLDTLELYAQHGGRQSITEDDIELLLYRLKHVNNRNSMNALIAEYLPLELCLKVLPIAAASNSV